jgi:hypothetical protein
MEMDAQTMESRQNALDEINRYLSILEDSVLSPGTPVSEANGYRDGAASVYRELRAAIEGGSYDGLSEMEGEMLVLLNRYMALSGKSEPLDELLKELVSERIAYEPEKEEQADEGNL